MYKGCIGSCETGQEVHRNKNVGKFGVIICFVSTVEYALLLIVCLSPKVSVPYYYACTPSGMEH